MDTSLAETLYDITEDVTWWRQQYEQENKELWQDSRERFHTLLIWAEDFERDFADKCEKASNAKSDQMPDYLIEVDEFVNWKLEEMCERHGIAVTRGEDGKGTPVPIDWIKKVEIVPPVQLEERILRAYMKPAVTAIAKKIEADLLNLYAGFLITYPVKDTDAKG